MGRDSTIVRIYSEFLYTFGFSSKAYKIPLIPSAPNPGLPTQPGYQDAAQGHLRLGVRGEAYREKKQICRLWDLSTGYGYLASCTRYPLTCTAPQIYLIF